MVSNTYKEVRFELHAEDPAARADNLTVRMEDGPCFTCPQPKTEP